jgi:type VI secretion system protein ImpE
VSASTNASTNNPRAFGAPEDMIAELANAIRREPAQAAHRWSMFQCLCVTGEWARALQQLQVYGQLDQDEAALRVVQTYRDLLRAERWREEVMAGTREPAFVYDDAPEWMRGLLNALSAAARNDLAAADEARAAALDAAPLVAGRAGEQTFEWLGDSDSRLGPVCELIAAGSYRWVALSDVAGWRVRKPAALIDLVWAPCTLALRDGTVLHGFMPARYPLQGALPADQRDALHLGSTTLWVEQGGTGVFGVGRKTFATDQGDFGLFELPECSFGEFATASGTASNTPLDDDLDEDHA